MKTVRKISKLSFIKLLIHLVEEFYIILLNNKWLQISLILHSKIMRTIEFSFKKSKINLLPIKTDPFNPKILNHKNLDMENFKNFRTNFNHLSKLLYQKIINKNFIPCTILNFSESKTLMIHFLERQSF